METMANSGSTPDGGADGFVLDANELATPEEWVVYVREETKHALTNGMAKSERYRLLVEEVVGSLIEFGVRPDIAADFRQLDQQMPEQEAFAILESVVAQTRFAPTLEPAEIPLRERKLVQHIVSEIHAFATGAAAP